MPLYSDKHDALNKEAARLGLPKENIKRRFIREAEKPDYREGMFLIGLRADEQLIEEFLLSEMQNVVMNKLLDSNGLLNNLTRDELDIALIIIERFSYSEEKRFVQTALKRIDQKRKIQALGAGRHFGMYDISGSMSADYCYQAIMKKSMFDLTKTARGIPLSVNIKIDNPHKLDQGLLFKPLKQRKLDLQEPFTIPEMRLK